MRLFWYLAVTCTVTIVIWTDAALGQRRPIADDTLGDERSIVTPLDPDLPVDVIEGGAERGDNLFHSFREFHVDEGRGVYFDDRGFANVISRVTGGVASRILGVLGTFGDANLFLINPSGIIFGEGARLDVRGSFVASTADSFVFENGFTFSSTNPQAPPLLTIDVPIGIQYGAQTPGAISVNQSELIVGNGRSLILAGGNVAIDGGFFAPGLPNGGRIELVGIANAETVELSSRGNILSLNLPESVARADISIINGSELDVSAEGGGSIAINAQNIEILSGSMLRAGISSDLGAIDSQAGNIVLNGTGEIQVGQSSLIMNNVEVDGTGNAGNINITAGSLFITDGGQLQALTRGQGNAGNVIINAREIVFDGALASSTVEIEEAVGNGGNVEIDTNSLEVRNGAQLIASTRGRGRAGNVIINADDRVLFDTSGGALSTVEENSVGSAGNIEIVTNSLEVHNGAQLAASTEGQGNAGNVIINARDYILFDNASISSRVEESGRGSAGNIEIVTNSLEVHNGAQLAASTEGQGNAGNVIISAHDYILFDGTITDSRFVSGAFSTVERDGIGDGGDVIINAGSLEVINGAALVAYTRGQGISGDVIITVRDRVLFDDSTASSRVVSNGIGDGGNVVINAGSLEVIDGTQLESSTQGQGAAGNVIINAADRVLFDGSAAISRVEAGGIGSGGNIEITTDSLEVRNNSELAANTNGQGRAGNVIVNANNQVLFDDSTAFSRVDSEAVGHGGNIHIHTDSLEAIGGAQLQTLTLGQGNAGNVIINADDQIVFSGSAVIISSVEEGGIGRGGKIQITTGSLDLVNGAQLQADTDGEGAAGDIIITAQGTVSIEGVGNDGLSSALFVFTSPEAQGQGGSITIDANSVRLADGAVINAETENEFRGGDVTITADIFEVIGGGQIITTTSGSGQAGNITLNVSDRITLSGFDPNYDNRSQWADNQGAASGLFANTAANSSGRGGNIRIRTGELNISDRARVSVNNQGSGIAGNIDVTAQSIELDRGRLTAETNTVEGGNIAITTDSLSLTDNAQISVNSVTEDEGGAGDIEVQARNIELDGASEITAETASGQGGNITLSDLEVLLLRNGSRVSTTAGTQQAEGDGGNINIDADFIVAVPNEDSDIRANAREGNGGRVDITTEGLFGIEARDQPTSLSDITASSELGVQGTININTPDVDPSRGLTELPADVVDASNQIAQTCPTDGDIAGEVGEFVVTGRGGVPADPAELLGGETVLTELAEVGDGGEGMMRGEIDHPSRVANEQAELVEAQGWVVGADGKVVLTAENPAVEPHGLPIAPVSCPSS